MGWGSWHLLPYCVGCDDIEGAIAGIEMKIDMSTPSRSPYIYTVYHPNNGSLLSSGECNSVEEGKAEVERILRENGFIC
jgi:hypothetical protein